MFNSELNFGVLRSLPLLPFVCSVIPMFSDAALGKGCLNSVFWTMPCPSLLCFLPAAPWLPAFPQRIPLFPYKTQLRSTSLRPSLTFLMALSLQHTSILIAHSIQDSWTPSFHNATTRLWCPQGQKPWPTYVWSSLLSTVPGYSVNACRWRT